MAEAVSSFTDKIPKLERFCCFDVKNGVFYATICLLVLWVFEFISSFFSGTVGGIVWGIIWSLVVAATYVLVLLVLKKDKPRTWMLPAIFMTLINVFLCCINGVIYLITLALFGAIILIVIAGLSAYYFLGLFTLYRNMSAAPTATVEPA